MIIELVTVIINSNRYTDYYKNCPFNLGMFEINKCGNRRCLSIGNNDYICSYNASSGIYSFNYCSLSKYETETGERLDTAESDKDITCNKSDSKIINHANVDLFFSECENNNNFTDYYYCNRKDNFKNYSYIHNRFCDSSNICDKKFNSLIVFEGGIIICCGLNLIVFSIFLCKLNRVEHKEDLVRNSRNNILIRNVNTITERNLNRRSSNRQNESNCSTEGNKNQQEIKDFKIENVENILVENKEVFVLNSNIMTLSSIETKKNNKIEDIENDDKNPDK